VNHEKSGDCHKNVYSECTLVLNKGVGKGIERKRNLLHE